MADLFDLVAKLTLDSSEYSSGLDSALGKVKKIGGTIAKVGTAAVGAAAAGIVAFGKSAVEAAANYETSFAQLQTIMDSTAVSTEKMSAGLMEMSSRMGVSASELAETTYNAISATGDTAGALSIVENATKLATAGFTDTASSLSVLTTAMNSYKMSAEETAGISDSLIAVQNLGVTTVAELSSSMGKAIASASAYSVDLYNLESAYVSMTKSGINTAESTTYISSMMKELGSDSTTVAKLIKSKTGKSFAQLMKDGKTLGDVLGVLNEAVDGDANALMNLWSSAEAGKASNAILSQGLEQFNDNLVQIKNSAGMTETAYKKMTQTLQHRTNLLKTNFENLKIAFGDNLIPGVGEIIDMLTGGVSDVTDAVQQGDWNKAFDVVGDTFGGLSAKLASYAPELASAAVTLLSGLGTALVKNADVLIGSAGEVIDVLIGALGNVGDFSGTAFKLISKLITSMSEKAGSFGETAGQIVTKIATAIGDNAANIISGAAKLITELGKGLLSEKNVTGYFVAAGRIVSGIVQSIPKTLPVLMDGGKDIIDGLVKGAVNGASTAAGEIVGSLIYAIKESITSGDIMKDIFMLFTSPGAYVYNKLNEAMLDPSTVGNFFVGLYKGMNPDISEDPFAGVKSSADNAVNYIVSAFDNGKITLNTEGAEISLDELMTAFTEASVQLESLTSEGGLLNKFSNGMSNISGFFKSVFGSEETQGLSDVTDAVETATTKTGELQTGVETAFAGIVENLGDMKTEIVATFTDAATETVAVWDSVPTEFSRIWNEIASAMNISEAATWGADMVSNFISGINSKLGELRAKVQEMANLVKANVGFSEPSDGPLSDFHTYAPDMMDLFMQGITENEGRLRDTVQNAFDFRDAMTAPETMTYSATGSGATETSGKIDAILDAIHEVADALRNLTIEMDGERVADLVDQRLGNRAAFVARV